MSVTPIHYQIQSDSKSTNIQFHPDIGNAAWGDIEQVGTELLTSVNERESSAWIIDLSQLDYMGSALVALLVRVWKAVQANNGKIVVVCGDGMPREVIKLAGLDSVWTISNTTADAYKTLGVRAPAPPADGTATPGPGSTPEPVSEFPILGVLSTVAALAAGGVLALVLSPTEIDPSLAQLGMFGSAGIAVAFGFLSLFKESSWGRGLGFVALLTGIAVGAMGYMNQSEVVAAPGIQGAEEPATPEEQPVPTIDTPVEPESADDDGMEDSPTSEARAVPADSSEDTSANQTTPSQEDATAEDQPTADDADTDEPEAELPLDDGPVTCTGSN